MLKRCDLLRVEVFNKAIPPITLHMNTFIVFIFDR